MHRTSEYGIAAHWKYKESGEGSKNDGSAEEEKLSWLRQILEWQQDMSDNREFVTLLKSDLNLFSDTVFCFTPTGDVKNLPTGSTPIDFAYSIHSAVGNKMVGAKVNGRLVPLTYTIQNGDRIEIITSGNSRGPSRDWLTIVRSTQARNKINQWFRSVSKEENVARGKELLIESAKSKNLSLDAICTPKYQEKVETRYGFHDWDAVLAAIGQGSLKEGQVVNRLYDAYLEQHPLVRTDEDIRSEHASAEYPHRNDSTPTSKSGIVVRGLHDISVRFSKCCSPVPGDEIVGFVTRGRGVSIHRTDCINIMNLEEGEKVRLIDAEWQPEYLKEHKNDLFIADIRIFGRNRTGLLVDITKIFTEKDIDINSIHSQVSKQEVATIDISFGVRGRDELASLMDRIRTIEGIMDIERTTG
jgi:GTP pyrophosphokinase